MDLRVLVARMLHSDGTAFLVVWSDPFQRDGRSMRIVGSRHYGITLGSWVESSSAVKIFQTLCDEKSGFRFDEEWELVAQVPRFPPYDPGAIYPTPSSLLDLSRQWVHHVTDKLVGHISTRFPYSLYLHPRPGESLPEPSPTLYTTRP